MFSSKIKNFWLVKSLLNLMHVYMFSHLKNVLVSASKISFKVQLQKIIIKNTVTTEINLN